jgi:S1-C subfamily serine protease
VLVAGSPLRFEFTFSQGIVSALGRSVKSEQSKVTYRRMIQTDAAVNQGSSGGPLIDVHGQAVGVITALYSPSGTDSGVAFAIPMDSQTRRVIARMMRGV